MPIKPHASRSDECTQGELFGGFDSIADDIGKIVTQWDAARYTRAS